MNIDKLISTSIYLLLLLFAVSIVWINFHSALWYDHDIFPDAYLARLMAEQKTLFPDNWIFGNRLFIIGTPVLSAALYSIVKDSVISMAIASSIMMILVLISFIWSFKNNLSKENLALGLLCLIGGVVLGVRASSYIAGLQIFYTMSSYYACYLIVILLSVGMYFRIRDNAPISILMFILILLLNLAVGIHSVRELLLLNIPLIVVLVLDLFRELRSGVQFNDLLSKQRKSICYVFLLFFLNICGILISTTIPASRAPVINPGLQTNIHALVSATLDSTTNVLEISGLLFLKRGLKCLPLFTAAVIIVSIVLYSLFLIVKKKDSGMMASWILFCLISVFGVWLAGIFVLNARPLYYFVYYLLATCSIVYLGEHIDKKERIYYYVVILGISSISYICNFTTDFLDYRQNAGKAKTVSSQLVKDGYQCIYDVYGVKPVFEAFSKDHILSCTCFIDFEMNGGYLFSANESLITTEMQRDEFLGKTLISMSKAHYQSIIDNASETFLDKFNNSMQLRYQQRIGNTDFLLFYPSKKVIGPPVF